MSSISYPGECDHRISAFVEADESEKIQWLQYDPKRIDGTIRLYDANCRPDELLQELSDKFPTLSIIFEQYTGKAKKNECGYNSIKKVYDIAFGGGTKPGKICDNDMIARCNKFIELDDEQCLDAISLSRDNIDNIIKYSFALKKYCRIILRQRSSRPEILMSHWKWLFRPEREFYDNMTNKKEESIKRMKIIKEQIHDETLWQDLDSIMQLVNEGKSKAAIEKYMETTMDFYRGIEKFVERYHHGTLSKSEFINHLSECMKNEKAEQEWTAIVNTMDPEDPPKDPPKIGHWFMIYCCLEKNAGNSKATS